MTGEQVLPSLGTRGSLEKQKRRSTAEGDIPQSFSRGDQPVKVRIFKGYAHCGPPAPLPASALFFGGHVDSQLLVLIAVWLLVLCLAHVLFETI